MFDAFLFHLHRGGAFAYYHTLPERRSYWFPVAEPPAVDYAAVTSNLYFSVHPSVIIPSCNAHGEVKPPHAVRSQIRTVAAINCLYAEYDAKHYGGDKAGIQAHLDTLTTPPPSALIDSGGGLHAYWLLQEPYLLDTDARREAAKLIQDRWVGVVGGDPGVKDLTRILRVPGSRNFKYDPPPVVTWQRCDLDCVYALQALTAHLPPVTTRTVDPLRIPPPVGALTIDDFNQRTSIRDVLRRHGYDERGRYRMVSPWSGSKRDGVSIDDDGNRAYVHTGGDPLCDGYWKRPFDVLRILDCHGDFKQALATIREATR